MGKKISDLSLLQLLAGNEWLEVAIGGGSPASMKVLATSLVMGGLRWFNVKDYGALGDGATDDTVAIQAAITACAAAGGGVVYFPAAIYIIAGALADTGGANAQILLPSIDVSSGNQISVLLLGPTPPTPVVSVIGAMPLPTGGAILKSTLATGTGGNCIGCKGPSGSFNGFSNLLVGMHNLRVRMPANPGHSAIDLSRVTAVSVNEVMVDTGTYNVAAIAEPTTATSYGIKFPALNNGAKTSIGVVNAVGFYKGFLFGEHLTAREMNAWGCEYAAESPAGFHAMMIERFQSIHCKYGITGTGGASFLKISQFNIEHAASGWMATVADIVDASNLLNGNLSWHSVLAGSGVSAVFNKTGGSGLLCVSLDLSVANSVAPVVTQAGTAVTLAASDAGNYIRFTAATAKTYTVQPNSTVALPTNGEWHLRNVGAGNLTIVQGAGVTISPPASGTLVVAPGAAVTLKRVGVDTFDLIGQTVSA
ncbi:glycosyl hydrolase family 28-related protein [Dyella japonica]|uniref:Rhamnogalacturonase A/B/Epimerase-like pectate lyase domain-containing protein n=1 Tax=Dyella japonica TaxID=231455 RepID=A0ABV2JUF7_9GAMM